jgi:hypothetical protein
MAFLPKMSLSDLTLVSTTCVPEKPDYNEPDTKYELWHLLAGYIYTGSNVIYPSDGDRLVYRKQPWGAYVRFPGE